MLTFILSIILFLFTSWLIIMLFSPDMGGIKLKKEKHMIIVMIVWYIICLIISILSQQ
jgi:hypothetical protein